MWNTLLCLAPFAIALVVAQAPEDKAKQADKPAAKPAEKATQKPSGKAASAVDFGVSTESEKLLDQAITKVEELSQFRADMRQTVEMLNYKFVADGQYAVGPEMKMLFELKIQLPDPGTKGTIKEVSNGKVHWKYQQVIDTPQVVKIDLQKLKTVLDNPKFDKDLRAQLMKRLGFGGVVPLLRGLRETQRFESHSEDMLGEIPVYVFQGSWRPEAINQSSYRGQQLSVANLPPHIPDKSAVWVGVNDGWPHKVQLESTKHGQGPASVITIEFLNPTIGVDLPDSTFTFEPPAGVKIDDQTDSLYRGLNAILQQGQGTAEKSKAAPPIGLAPGATESTKSADQKP